MANRCIPYGPNVFNTRDFNRRLHILWMALQTFFTILLAVFLLGVPYWLKKRRPIPKDFEIPNKCQYETNVDELENGDDDLIEVREVLTTVQVADNDNSSNCSDDEDIDLRTKLINHHTDKDTT